MSNQSPSEIFFPVSTTVLKWQNIGTFNLWGIRLSACLFCLPISIWQNLKIPRKKNVLQVWIHNENGQHLWSVYYVPIAVLSKSWIISYNFHNTPITQVLLLVGFSWMERSLVSYPSETSRERWTQDFFNWTRQPNSEFRCTSIAKCAPSPNRHPGLLDMADRRRCPGEWKVCQVHKRT